MVWTPRIKKRKKQSDLWTGYEIPKPTEFQEVALERLSGWFPAAGWSSRTVLYLFTFIWKVKSESVFLPRFPSSWVCTSLLSLRVPESGEVTALRARKPPWSPSCLSPSCLPPSYGLRLGKWRKAPNSSAQMNIPRHLAMLCLVIHTASRGRGNKSAGTWFGMRSECPMWEHLSLPPPPLLVPVLFPGLHGSTMLLCSVCRLRNPELQPQFHLSYLLSDRLLNPVKASSFFPLLKGGWGMCLSED